MVRFPSAPLWGLWFPRGLPGVSWPGRDLGAILLDVAQLFAIGLWVIEV